MTPQIDHSTHVALDLFAGSGVGVAIQQLGAKDLGVEKMPEARETRRLNRMATVYDDVWDVHLVGKLGLAFDTLWGSPPCQAFSPAGNGAGRRALDNVIRTLESGAYRNIETLRSWANTLGDERIGLVLAPLHYIWRFTPKYVALEQVPAVLPVWEGYARHMRELGYSVWTGYLHAEQYGVPQTRKRAYLIARRDPAWEAAPPPPTHSKYYPHNPAKLDLGVPRWISMGEAITDWNDGSLYASAGRTSIHTAGARQRPMHEPAATVTGATTSQAVRVFPHSRPAPTITGGGSATGGWEPFARGGRTAILRSLADERAATESTQLEDEGGVNDWPWRRPAPTIVGSWRSEGGLLVGRQLNDSSRRDVGGHQTSVGLREGMLPAVRVTLDEAATLQSYPSGFEFAGAKGKAGLQIGNAVPPLVARRVLEHLWGAR